MTISKRDIQLLVGLLGILAAVLTYFMVYTKYEDKTQTLKTENISLKQQADLLETLNLQKQDFITKTEKFDKEVIEIASKYDAGHIREDEIMYISNMEDTSTNNVSVAYINMSTAEPVIVGATVTNDTTEASTDGITNGTTTMVAVDNGIQLYRAPVDFGISTSYVGLKKMLGYIYATGGRKNIDSINLAFDSASGQLGGTILLNMYFMTGTNAVYTSTSIPTMSSGVENIFRTADRYRDAAIDESIEKAE